MYLYPFRLFNALNVSGLFSQSTIALARDIVLCYIYPSLSLIALLPILLCFQLDLARKLEKIAAEKGVQLFLASDVIVADKFAPDANNKVLQQ